MLLLDEDQVPLDQESSSASNPSPLAGGGFYKGGTTRSQLPAPSTSQPAASIQSDLTGRNPKDESEEGGERTSSPQPAGKRKAKSKASRKKKPGASSPALELQPKAEGAPESDVDRHKPDSRSGYAARAFETPSSEPPTKTTALASQGSAHDIPLSPNAHLPGLGLEVDQTTSNPSSKPVPRVPEAHSSTPSAPKSTPSASGGQSRDTHAKSKPNEPQSITKPPATDPKPTVTPGPAATSRPAQPGTKDRHDAEKIYLTSKSSTPPLPVQGDQAKPTSGSAPTFGSGRFPTTSSTTKPPAVSTSTVTAPRDLSLGRGIGRIPDSSADVEAAFSSLSEPGRQTVDLSAIGHAPAPAYTTKDKAKPHLTQGSKDAVLDKSPLDVDTTSNPAAPALVQHGDPMTGGRTTTKDTPYPLHAPPSPPTQLRSDGGLAAARLEFSTSSLAKQRRGQASDHAPKADASTPDSTSQSSPPFTPPSRPQSERGPEPGVGTLYGQYMDHMKERNHPRPLSGVSSFHASSPTTPSGTDSEVPPVPPLPTHLDLQTPPRSMVASSANPGSGAEGSTSLDVVEESKTGGSIDDSATRRTQSQSDDQAGSREEAFVEPDLLKQLPTPQHPVQFLLRKGEMPSQSQHVPSGHPTRSSFTSPAAGTSTATDPVQSASASQSEPDASNPASKPETKSAAGTDARDALNGSQTRELDRASRSQSGALGTAGEQGRTTKEGHSFGKSPTQNPAVAEVQHTSDSAAIHLVKLEGTFDYPSLFLNTL